MDEDDLSAAVCDSNVCRCLLDDATQGVRRSTAVSAVLGTAWRPV